MDDHKQYVAWRKMPDGSDVAMGGFPSRDHADRFWNAVTCNPDFRGKMTYAGINCAKQ